MAGLDRKLRPSELNDVFRLVALAEGIAADSLDDIECLSSLKLRPPGMSRGLPSISLGLFAKWQKSH